MAVPPRATSDRRFTDPRAEQLAELVEPTVTAHGLFLEEIQIQTSGARTVLRVVVDYYSGTENVSLDTLGGLSEALNVTLDNHAEEPPLAQLDTYELEVSTPGATRPLTEPRHFRRNLGRTLELTPVAGSELTATLRAVDETGITVQEVKPPPKKGMKPKVGPDTHISFDSIARARVQVEFSHND
ncbi:ribosome maturation factor RimP [Nesterenkonia alba]|uniref:ribosome maturation factor RimP n=1 Tax=Nesterenkonia alba TaxID=515814 RepID=UPI0003B3930F|nr:ribosome maturation factor RimP [Nesterenkonia alba]